MCSSDLLYTWGTSVDDARRHVEVLEFLLEVIGRTSFAKGAVRDNALKE